MLELRCVLHSNEDPLVSLKPEIISNNFTNINLFSLSFSNGTRAKYITKDQHAFATWDKSYW